VSQRASQHDAPDGLDHNTSFPLSNKYSISSVVTTEQGMCLL